MPPAYAALVLAVGTFWAGVIAVVVEMVAMQLVTKLLASDHGTQLSSGASQEYTGTVEPRRIVYGQVLLSGLNVIPPWCHGLNNDMLDQVYALAGHEMDSLGDCYSNQEKIPSASITAITGSANDGLVTTGTFANKLWIRRATGASTDTVDSILYAAWPLSWTASHVGTGVAKLYLQYKFDQTVYSGGKSEIRVIGKGKKLYDPRLDTSPGAHPTNPTYMRFSTNPALAIVDQYLADHPDLPKDLRQKVLQARDDLERTVRIRSKYADIRG